MGDHQWYRTTDQPRPQLRLALSLLDADRPEEARLVLGGASAVSRRGHDPASDPLHHWALAYSSWLLGRWDQALGEVATGLDLAEEQEQPAWAAMLAGVGIVVNIHRDAIALAWGLVGRVQRQLPPGPACNLWFGGAEALLVDAEGQPEVALSLLADAWDRARPLAPLSADRLFGPALVRLAMGIGHRRLARVATAQVHQRAADQAAPGHRGAVLMCQGLAEDDPDPLIRAVDTLREARRPLEFASACELAWASLVRRGDVERADTMLAQAVTAYRHLGATHDLARLPRAIVQGSPPTDRSDTARCDDVSLDPGRLSVVKGGMN